MSDTPPSVHALGYSENDFDPHRPGRLCRGRERWIEPWPDGPEPGEVTLCRGIVTGAAFHDDTARDAVRGLTHIGVDVGALIGGPIWLAGGIYATALVSAAISGLALVSLVWGLRGWQKPN